MSDRLAQAYEEFANLYGLAGRDWKYATHAIVVDRGPPFRETHRVTDLAPDRGWDFGDALRTLDRTAMARWRAGLGPGEFPAAAADELLVPHAGDLPLPADALAVVARECGRRADSRFSHFVANLTWDRPDHVGVQLHGMLLRAGDWRFACRSGRAQLAACRLASAAADLGPPRALYVLIAREPSGGLRFRATRDGEAAVRLLHVTEHARLRSLRKLPRGL